MKLLNTNQQSRDLAILWTKKGIGITTDPFGAGAYNLQSISALRPKCLGDETTDGVTMTFMAVLAVILALASVGLVRDSDQIIVLNRVCFH